MVAGTFQVQLPPWHLYCDVMSVMLDIQAAIPALILADPHVDALAQSLRCCTHPRSRSAHLPIAVACCGPAGTLDVKVVADADAEPVATDTSWWCPICFARRTDDSICGDVMDGELRLN